MKRNNSLSQTLFYGIFILGFVALLPSCKKEEQLIVGTWRIDKIEARYGGTGEWENEPGNCSVGAVEEYEKSGKYTYYPAPGNPCPGSSGMPSFGTYRFTASGTKLMFTYDDSWGEYDKSVESITKNTMILSHNTGLATGKEFRYTFSKQ